MLRIGLTGGIGSGKSTVVGMLRECGVPAIEADKVAREVSRRGGPAYEGIVREFGEGILGASGEIDRRRLAAIVFASQPKLKKLNGIVHPEVLKRVEPWLKEQWRKGEPFAVLEAPLLVEIGYHRRFDRLAVVWCRPEQQRERLARRGMSGEEIEQRMAAQMTVEEKKRLAHDLIDNSGTPEDTRRQVKELVERWKEAGSGAAAAGEGE